MSSAPEPFAGLVPLSGQDRSRCVATFWYPKTDRIEPVSKVSAWQKLGVVARVAARQAGRSRIFHAMKCAVRTTVSSFARTLHQLWLEVVGTVFLTIAAFGAVALVREYMKYEAGRTTAGRIAIACCFTLMFAWFGVTSFWRVRRKSQRP